MKSEPELETGHGIVRRKLRSGGMFVEDSGNAGGMFAEALAETRSAEQQKKCSCEARGKRRAQCLRMKNFFKAAGTSASKRGSCGEAMLLEVS